MASELESLLVRIEADTTALRRGLASTETELNRHGNSVQRTLNKSQRSFDELADGASRGMAVAAAAVAGLVAVTVRAAAGAADMSRLAEAAGLTTAQLQGLQTAALENGIAVGRLDGAVASFAQKLGEARQRSGGFYEFLKTHVPTLAEQIRQTTSTAEALEVMASAFARVKNPADRAALANQAFGESGAQLADMMRKGTFSIAEATKQSEKYGLAISDSAIQATRDLEKEIGILSKSISTGLVEALGIAAPYLTAFMKKARDVRASGESANSALLKAMQNPGKGAFNIMDAAETGSKEAVGAALQQLADANFRAAQDAGTSLGKTIVDGWQAEVKRPRVMPELKFLPKPPDYTGVDALKAQEAQRLQLVIGYEKQRYDIARSTVDLIMFEQARELENFRRLKEQGKLTEQQFADARIAVSRNTTEKIKAHHQEESQHLRQQLAPLAGVIENSLTRPFDDAFAGNIRSAKEYFREILAGLAKVFYQALVLKPLMNSLTSSGSPLAFLGPVLGGARASGGPVSANVPYLVGERGPEIIIPNTASNVIPNHRLGGSGGGSSVVYNIDARGADAGVEQRVMRAVAELERRRPSAVDQLGAMRKRFPTR